MFAHENLHVYRKALDFANTTMAWTATWETK